jgi:hypothetical protein
MTSLDVRPSAERRAIAGNLWEYDALPVRERQWRSARDVATDERV